ncbi:MAG: hypothetical protein KC547_18325, partial [Anaerolineae bacterium]|nr:hypothetical protein [Anaerolineae bacterium]
ETLLDRAVAGTRALHNHNARAWVLTMLARRLPERRKALLDAALDAVPGIVDATAQGMEDVMRSNAIAQMADLLDGEQVTRAFEIGLTLVDEGRNWLPRAVAPLVDRLDEAQRARALDAVLLVEDDWGRKDGLLALVRHAQGETQQRAFQALLMIRHGEAREVIRQALAAIIDPALSESGGAFAAQIDDAEQKAWALDVLRTLPAADAAPAGVAADTNTASVDEQLAKALNIRWEEDRFPVLERLLSQLSPEQIRIVLEDAHASVSDAGTRDWLIGEIAAYADGEVLAALFERAVTPWQMLADCSVILNWAGKLGEPFSAEAMAYVESRLTPRLQSSTRILLLKRLLPHLTGAAKHSTRSAEALATALTNDYPPGRARDLIDVIDVLDEADRAAAFEALYASVMSYPEFAPSPDAAQYPLAANNEDQKIERVQHASALLNPIQDERRVHLVARIVDLTLTLNNRVWVVSFLKQVAALLDSDQLARALTTVNAWDDSDERAAALRALRPYLSKAQVSDLPPDPAEDVGSYREFRRRLDLARNANTDERPELLEQALAAGKQLQKLGERRSAFIHLAQAGVPEALDTLMESVSHMEEDSRWQILLQLYPLLSDQADVRRMIWRGIITQFEQMRSGSREFVFDWDHWYQPWTQLQSLMTAELHARIGLLVLEIVRDWRWA